LCLGVCLVFFFCSSWAISLPLRSTSFYQRGLLFSTRAQGALHKKNRDLVSVVQELSHALRANRSFRSFWWGGGLVVKPEGRGSSRVGPKQDPSLKPKTSASVEVGKGNVPVQRRETQRGVTSSSARRKTLNKRQQYRQAAEKRKVGLHHPRGTKDEPVHRFLF